MPEDTRQSLTASVREVLAAPPERVQGLLTELGWDEVVADDPASATRILFTEHGRVLGRSPILDRVTLDALAGELDEPVAGVCYPLSDQPSSTDRPLVGLVLQPPTTGTLLAAPVVGVDGVPGLALVPADALDVQQLPTFAGDLPWCRVTGDRPVKVIKSHAWADALSAARIALSAELIGVSREALRLAAEHTSTRVQFGHPIASFQAVRHRLADAHVAITAAEAVLEAACADGGPFAALAAKAQAGRAHSVVSRQALQVCGAMGASLEHPLHRFVSRGVALDALLGTSRALISELGEEVLMSGETPRIAYV